MNQPLRLYDFLSRRRFPRSYTGKILLVAFWGTHIPLLALLFHFIASAQLSTEATTRALLVALFATLAGTGATLFALHHLLAPVRLTTRGLRQYLDDGKLPELPGGYPDEAGRLMEDTRRALRQLDELIEFMAGHDHLTALPSRTLFHERLAEAVAQPREGGAALAVLALDLDGMKSVNQMYGYPVGDALLRAVADRLWAEVGNSAAFARTGSDEFALFLTVPNADTAVAAARRFQNALRQPFRIEGQEIAVTAPVGIALFPPNEETEPDRMLRKAELAMRQAAADAAGQGVAFYSADMDARVRRRIALERDLKGALNRGEMSLAYQPQVENVGGAVVGVEALMRWRHPEYGDVSPAEFIPVAEETGIIVPLGEWALRTACEQGQAWSRLGVPPVRVAVNLSPAQFRTAGFADVVARVLAETGLPGAALELEVTESLAMADAAQTAEVLDRLHGMGVSVSLDDFGTGYSSLSHLGRLPIDVLKIDRSFVRDMTENPEHEAITRGIVGLARSLNLEVIAEGVETPGQLDRLREIGCGRSQGYLFSRPVPPDVMASLLAGGARPWSKDLGMA